MTVVLPITIRKRTITEQDLQQIKATISEHWDKGHTQISHPLNLNLFGIPSLNPFMPASSNNIIIPVIVKLSEVTSNTSPS